MNIDKTAGIITIYYQCNIIIYGATIPTIYDKWLAAMGMLETLKIQGVDAKPWQEYKG